jgi:hypothetical protein
VKKVYAAVLSLGFLNWSGTALAKTGNELYAQITTPNQRMYALEYIEGVLDESDQYSFDVGPDGLLLHPHICTSGIAITYGQQVDIVAKYLSDHPEIRHLNANVLVMKAMIQAFPCAKNPRT